MERRRRRSAYPRGGGDRLGEERDEPLAGADLAPGPARGRGPRRPRWRIESLGWRALAVGVAAAEIALLAWLITGPALQVRHVTVSGLAHLDREQVVVVTSLEGRQSVVRVDSESTQRRLERLTWVRTAAVQPLLPDRVQVVVEEWRPVALYRNRLLGRPFYVSDQGIALGASESASEFPLIEGAAPADPRVGSRVVEPQLLAALLRLHRALPGVYGQPVVKFSLDCVGGLSLTTGRGVRIIFGRVLTPEEFSSLSLKLSSLKSIAATDPDVRNPDKIEYINLENVQQPAVKFKADRPPPPPAPSPTPAATPSARPAPGGTPNPAGSPVGPVVSPVAPTAKPSPAPPVVEVTTCR